MTDSKHTPGPWRLGPYSPGYPPAVLAGEGEDTHRVCERVTLENGRLIAAAPELLAALREVMEFRYSNDDRQLDANAKAIALLDRLARVDGGGK